MFCQADDYKNGMEVTAFVGDRPVCSARIIDLVAEWADAESIDGELHPYLDATLNVLSDLTYALIKVVERMERDDPHKAALLEIYAAAYRHAQTLAKTVADD
jgi:hypothetical protein